MFRIPMNNPGGSKYKYAISRAIVNAVEIVFGPAPGDGYDLYMDVVNGRVNAKLKDIIDMQRVHNFMEMSGIEDKPITIHNKDGKSVKLDPAILLWALAAETISTANNCMSEVTCLQASFIAFLFRFLSSQDSLYLIGYAENLYKGYTDDYKYVQEEVPVCYEKRAGTGEHPLLMEKDPVFYDLIHNSKQAILETIENGNGPEHELMDQNFVELAMDWCKKNHGTRYFSMHWETIDEELGKEVAEERVLKYKAAATAKQHIDSMGVKYSKSVYEDLFIAYTDAIIDYYKGLLDRLYNLDYDDSKSFYVDHNADDTGMSNWHFKDEDYDAFDYLEYLAERFPIKDLIYDKKAILFGDKKVAAFPDRLRRFGRTDEDLWHISCVCELDEFINAAC